jgi:hypothetical protein
LLLEQGFKLAEKQSLVREYCYGGMLSVCD